MKALLRALLGSLAAISLAIPAMPAHADAAAEARALGGSTGAILRGSLTTGRALVEELTPGFDPSPPHGGLDEHSLNAITSDVLRADCAGPYDGPECELIDHVEDDARARSSLTPGMREDAEVQNALSASGTALDGVAGGYSGCTTETYEAGVKTHDRQFCHRYYLRELGASCTKTLNVRVDWTCPSGSTGPHGAHPRHCRRVTAKIPTCGIFETLSEDKTQCIHNETEATRPPTMIDEIAEFPASPRVLESWNNPCANYESRVPPGALPPDGVPTSESLPLRSSGRLDKCIRADSVCSSPFPQTRIINDLPVTRACWAWTNAFDCVTQKNESDCDQPRHGECSLVGEPECVDQDAVDGFCTAEKYEYSCTVRDTTRHESRLNCGAQVFVDREGNQWDASSTPDPDFLTVVAWMEAGRQGGRYMDQGSLRVFDGVENRCKKKLFGLVNCCARPGADVSMLNNLSVAMGVAGTVGKAMASYYTFDILLSIDSPTWIINGFGKFFGMGLESPLMDFILGHITAGQFAMSLIPGPWQLAMIAIQLSGILSCDEKEQFLGLKRDAELCVENGSWCSKRLPVIRTCIERTYSYCCFNSRLAKLVNRQGRQQLGINDNKCTGFSASQLQSLDLSAMDLSEFMDEIKAAAVEIPAIAPERVEGCAAGAGGCP